MSPPSKRRTEQANMRLSPAELALRDLLCELRRQYAPDMTLDAWELLAREELARLEERIKGPSSDLVRKKDRDDHEELSAALKAVWDEHKEV